MFSSRGRRYPHPSCLSLRSSADLVRFCICLTRFKFNTASEVPRSCLSISASPLKLLYRNKLYAPGPGVVSKVTCSLLPITRSGSSLNGSLRLMLASGLPGLPMLVRLAIRSVSILIRTVFRQHAGVCCSAFRRSRLRISSCAKRVNKSKSSFDSAVRFFGIRGAVYFKELVRGALGRTMSSLMLYDQFDGPSSSL